MRHELLPSDYQAFLQSIKTRVREALVNKVTSRSYTHLVKGELARSAVIGKDSFTLATASPQVLLTPEKHAVFCRERERSLPQTTSP
jgi:hypothetical protein